MWGRNSRVARRGAGALAGMAIAGTGLAAFAAVAQAQDAGTSDTSSFDGAYTAVAEAHALRLQVIDPDAPLSPRVADGGGPTAKASLDSLGESRAYSAFPDPGEDTTAYPSTFRGAAGGAPVPPDYPLAISSRYPAPPSVEAGSGPVALKAESGADFSTASARVGSPGEAELGTSVSHATVERAGGDLLAAADTVVTSFTAGSLSIGRYQSTASGKIAPDGKLSLSSSTSMTYADVGGVAITLSPQGLVVNGTESDAGPVSEALTAAGIEMEFLPAERGDGKITTAALRVTRQLESGETIISTLGGATVAINAPEATPAAVPEPGPSGQSAPAAAPPEQGAGPDASVRDAVASSNGAASSDGAVPPADAGAASVVVRAQASRAAPVGTGAGSVAVRSPALVTTPGPGGPGSVGEVPDATPVLREGGQGEGAVAAPTLANTALSTPALRAGGRVWVLPLIAAVTASLVILLGGRRFGTR